MTKINFNHKPTIFALCFALSLITFNTDLNANSYRNYKRGDHGYKSNYSRYHSGSRSYRNYDRYNRGYSRSYRNNDYYRGSRNYRSYDRYRGYGYKDNYYRGRSYSNYYGRNYYSPKSFDRKGYKTYKFFKHY